MLIFLLGVVVGAVVMFFLLSIGYAVKYAKFLNQHDDHIMAANKLHPMGPYTFAVACACCANNQPDNYNQERCSRCLCEVESGFEPLQKDTF